MTPTLLKRDRIRPEKHHPQCRDQNHYDNPASIPSLQGDQNQFNTYARFDASYSPTGGLDVVATRLLRAGWKLLAPLSSADFPLILAATSGSSLARTCVLLCCSVFEKSQTSWRGFALVSTIGIFKSSTRTLSLRVSKSKSQSTISHRSRYARDNVAERLCLLLRQVRSQPLVPRYNRRNNFH
jgi:hypothetical protein